METEELTYDSKKTIVSYEDFDGYLASYMLKHGLTVSKIELSDLHDINMKSVNMFLTSVDEAQTKNMMQNDMGGIKYISDMIFVMIGRPEFVIVTIRINRTSLTFTPAKPHRVGQMED